jgi:hypothetical protein
MIGHDELFPFSVPFILLVIDSLNDTIYVNAWDPETCVMFASSL